MENVSNEFFLVMKQHLEAIPLPSRLEENPTKRLIKKQYIS